MNKKDLWIVLGAIFIMIFVMIYSTASTWTADIILYKGETVISNEQYIELTTQQKNGIDSLNNNDSKVTITYLFDSKSDYPYLTKSAPSFWYQIRHSAQSNPSSNIMSIASIFIAMLCGAWFIGRQTDKNKTKDNSNAS